MTIQDEIERAQNEAKQRVIRDRILHWLERSKDVEILSEIAGMERLDCSVTAREASTGELTVTLYFSGIEDLHVRRVDNEWHAAQ